MKITLRRLAGLFVVLLAATSLVVSLFAIFQVWRLRQPFQANMNAGLELISTTLQTTANGLSIAGTSLDSTAQSITTLQETVATLGQSIDDTKPMLATLSTLMGDDLPDTITSAQTSLETAQASAKIIDQVLRVLTIFNPNAYRPAVPLDEAVGQVSESLDPLPGSFATVEVSLNATTDNLDLIKTQIDQIARDIGAITTSLADAQQVIEDYQGVVAQTQATVQRIQAAVPRLTQTLVWLLTFILIWLGVPQAGLLLSGWQLFRRPVD